MNEELRARAIEAAERAEHEWCKAQVSTPGAEPWADPDVTLFVDAVLSVVADWCDERGAPRPSEMGIGWNAALDELAAACRPVGEEA